MKTLKKKASSKENRERWRQQRERYANHESEMMHRTRVMNSFLCKSWTKKSPDNPG